MPNRKLRYRVRRGFRRRGSLLTVSNLVIASILSMIAYTVTGSLILPIFLLTLITLTAPWMLAFKGRIIEALGASLLSSAIAGCILFYSTQMRPLIDVIAPYAATFLSENISPFIMTVAGLITGGLISHGAAIYYFYTIVEGLGGREEGKLLSNILAWVLLSHATVAAALLMKTSGRIEYIKSRAFISISLMMISIACLYYLVQL